MKAFSKVPVNMSANMPTNMPESNLPVGKVRELNFSVETKVQMRLETDGIVQFDARKAEAHLIGPVEGGRALRHLHSLNSKRPNACSLKFEIELPDRNQPADLKGIGGKQMLAKQQFALEQSIPSQQVSLPVQDSPANNSPNIFIHQGQQHSLVLSKRKIAQLTQHNKQDSPIIQQSDSRISHELQSFQNGETPKSLKKGTEPIMDSQEFKEKRRFKIFSPKIVKGSVDRQQITPLNGENEERLNEMSEVECSSHNIGERGLDQDNCLQCALIRQYLKPRNSKLKQSS